MDGWGGAFKPLKLKLHIDLNLTPGNKSTLPLAGWSVKGDARARVKMFCGKDLVISSSNGSSLTSRQRDANSLLQHRTLDTFQHKIYRGAHFPWQEMAFLQTLMYWLSLKIPQVLVQDSVLLADRLWQPRQSSITNRLFVLFQHHKHDINASTLRYKSRRIIDQTHTFITASHTFPDVKTSSVCDSFSSIILGEHLGRATC